MNVYDIGDTAIVEATFYQSDGTTPTNPTDVTLHVLRPDGTGYKTIFSTGGSEWSRPSTGVYQCEIPIEQSGPTAGCSGWYKYRFHGTGNNNADQEGALKVRAQTVPDQT